MGTVTAMEATLSDPALIGSLVTSAVAVGIALAGNWRDNQLRRKERDERRRIEAAARERADLSQASLVTCVYLFPENPTKSDSLTIALSNWGNEPILDLQLQADGGGAVFSLVRNAEGPEASIEVGDLSHEQWGQMEYFTDNGVPLVHPGKTFVFSASSSERTLVCSEVIVTFRLLSGNAYGIRNGKLFRNPEFDLQVEGSLISN